ncbi:MAG: PadR family transcriptional regulator [Candidatus Bathyarchaeota archaeon]|nr:PadR family transcriptional regulator [Candidatus Bathyarchaeota archaeon]
MNQIQYNSRGKWRPSPGSIYPLLDQLCKEGIISKNEDGRYEITEKSSEFEWPWGTPTRRPQSIESIIEEMNSYLAYFEDLKHMDPSKIVPNREKLKNFRDRLTTLLDTE